MTKHYLIPVFLAGTLFSACGGSVLPLPEEQLQSAIVRLAQGDEATDATLAEDLAYLNDVLVETFAENYIPVPEKDIVPYVPLSDGKYEGINAFRWGYALSAYPDHEKSVGAFVARPTSTGYATQVPLVVNGDWSTLMSTNFRSYEREFPGGGKDEFIAGTSARVEALNHVVYKTNKKDIVFQYDTNVVLRRVRDAALPMGEALIYWEEMPKAATRIEGGYNAYNDWLRNVQIYIPFTDDLSWTFISGWSVAGGSLFIFSASGTSGDVAEGIRNDFADWEEYLVAQDLSCLPDCE